MPTTTDGETRPLWQRLLWFVGLWAGSVAALGVIGYAIKLVLKS
jgi:preprotein translocase subunit Sss1